MVWLGVALVLVAIEAVTVDFTFLMLAGGAVGASVAAALGGGPLVQAVVAALVSVALLAIVRPWMKRRLTGKAPEIMGTAAQVGRSAYALDRVTPAGGQGQALGRDVVGPHPLGQHRAGRGGRRRLDRRRHRHRQPGPRRGRLIR